MIGYHNIVGEIEGLEKNLEEGKAFTANLTTIKEKIIDANNESNQDIFDVKGIYVKAVDDFYGNMYLLGCF